MRKTNIIAVCGVDGAGKTSLLKKLQSEINETENHFLFKDFKSNIKNVEKFHARLYNDGRDWTEGQFAKSAAIATSFDFIYHYEKNILPLIGKTKNIFCDRYSFCYQSYLSSVGCEKEFINSFFSKIIQPDIIIYISIPMEIINDRYNMRGGAVENETTESIRLFKESYENQIPKSTVPVVEISNVGSFEESYEKFKSIICKYINDEKL